MTSMDFGAAFLKDENLGNPGRHARIFGTRSRIALSLCFAAIGTAPADLPEDKRIVERLRADVYYLASDTLEGRGVLTPGVDLAAQHIRAEFRRIGLKSGPADGSYYQPIEYRRSPEAAPTMLKNVIGTLDGKGDLADQVIVIGAHYDHLGHGEFELRSHRRRCGLESIQVPTIMRRVSRRCSNWCAASPSPRARRRHDVVWCSLRSPAKKRD